MISDVRVLLEDELDEEGRLAKIGRGISSLALAAQLGAVTPSTAGAPAKSKAQATKEMVKKAKASVKKKDYEAVRPRYNYKFTPSQKDKDAKKICTGSTCSYDTQSVRRRMDNLLEVRWSLQPLKGKFKRDSNVEIEGPHSSWTSSEYDAVKGAKEGIKKLLQRGEKDDPHGRPHLHKGKRPKGSEYDTRPAFSGRRAAPTDMGGPQAMRALDPEDKDISLFKHPDIQQARRDLHAAIRAKRARMKDPKEKAARRKAREDAKSDKASRARAHATHRGPWD